MSITQPVTSYFGYEAFENNQGLMGIINLNEFSRMFNVSYIGTCPNERH